MPKNDAGAEGRSQKLTLPDMVTMDRKTYQNLMRLIGNSIDRVQSLRHHEVIITSLNFHLSELEYKELATSLDISKALLLLEIWENSVPNHHADIAQQLDYAFHTLNVALAASKLGGDSNE